MHSFYNRQICPLEGFIFSAHILSYPPAPRSFLFKRPTENQILPEQETLPGTWYHLIIFLAIHAEAPIHPPAPPFFVQTPHPKSKYARQSNKHYQAVDTTSLSF